MNPIKFEKHRKGETIEYHFYPKNEELVIEKNEHFSNNEILWKNWAENQDIPETFLKFNISNFTTVENVLLYMLIIWELSKGKEMLGIGIWETDSIRKSLNKIPKLVNWEYNLKHEYIIENNYVRKNIGYQKAESPVITQHSKLVNETPTNKTGIFEIKRWIQVINATFEF